MDFFTAYQQSYEHTLSGRYFLPEIIYKCLDGYSIFSEKATLGFSEKHRPIFRYRLGTGKTKLLIWSQMHGNETTTTKALVDLCALLHHNSDLLTFVHENYEIVLIPVLNPDGAVAYTRNNANDIDLNRDAKELSQKESSILFDVFSEFQPDLCLNMHDQRTIFSAGNTNKPATISFLAPAADVDKTETKARKTAMALIATMRNALEAEIPQQIGRYDDTFNENCFGDAFQSRGISTILFESGHYQNDYNREITRKYICFSLWNLLISIGKVDEKQIYKNYFSIPENAKLFKDIIVYNAKLSENSAPIDIAIQYRETLVGERIEFVPVLDSVGDCKRFFAHKFIEANEAITILIGNDKIALGEIIKGVVINGKEKRF